MRSFYTADGSMNVRALTDENGAIKDTWDFDAFGNVVGRTGSTANNFTFAGEYNDPDLGMVYLRNRYYRPPTGTFLSRDFLEVSSSSDVPNHAYVYAFNRPPTVIDPSGQEGDLAEQMGVETAANDESLTSAGTNMRFGQAVNEDIEANQQVINIGPLVLAGVLAAAYGAGAEPERAFDYLDRYPIADPAQKNKKDNVWNQGRIQVQGSDIADWIRRQGKSGTSKVQFGAHFLSVTCLDNTMSWGWSIPVYPLPAFVGLAGLETLRLQLPSKSSMLMSRSKSFQDAERFIVGARASGGVGPSKTSFQDRSERQNNTDKRVDIVVDSGLAFVKP